ncbi:cardiotrophin-like cytokine factor 1 [Aplochiton taeniatus]
MLGGVLAVQLALLLAAAAPSARAQDASHSLANERTSIERTYELTKYLEHQLKEIKDTYLSYLGPPFNDKDFSPPRPNSTALSLPSAATRLELWRGLENRARLAQNQRAYAVLLGAVRELARSTLCPYLQTSLLHFSTGLDGLLGSISGLMSSLGYALPPPSDASGGGGGDGPQYPRREAGGDGGRAGSRPAPLMTQSLYRDRARAGPGGRDNQGRDAEARPLPPLSLFYPFGGEEEHPLLTRPVPLSLRRPAAMLSPPPLPPLYSSPASSSSSSSSSSPLLSVRPALNDFSRKVEGFWVLRELQSWLWRSAKDFNRLKKRLRA